VTLVGTEATGPDKVSPSTYAKSAVISGITASAVGRRGELDIPPAPKMAVEDQAETQCPYCFHVIEDELRGRNNAREHQWRRHVMKDLDPYVCLLDGCSLAYPCFKTTEEWIHHIRWAHTTRYSCQVVGHEDVFFEAAAELE
jgi:predicted small lipoprotein YifL